MKWWSWKNFKAAVRLIRGADIAIMIVYASVLLFFSSVALSRVQAGENIEVSHDGQKWVYSLEEDQIFKPLEEAGTCIIEISNRNARVKSSNCPQQICIRTGSIPSNGSWIACLPHSIFITVTGSQTSLVEDENGIDASAY